jgi:ABC-type nitrate/sulfonate/bicarbonate transport system substrate-binding protein
MKKIRITGVPEHFNYPWHFGIKNQLFDVELLWNDEKGGTGAMASALDNNEADMALMLTEGATKYIAEEGKAKILQVYVKTPLIWGIHARPNISTPIDFSAARFARSRSGSGSHIMAYVFAENQNVKIQNNQFVDVSNIDGALEAFKNNDADILLWEKFMTQQFVDKGEMRRIEDCVSPWPCFVLVASNRILEQAPEAVNHICETILSVVSAAQQEKELVQNIADFYQISYLDCEKWYGYTEWQTSRWISYKMLQNVISTLNRVGILKNQLQPEEMCFFEKYIY